MFPLKDIRQHITKKLDAEIGVLKKYRSTKLDISESAKDQDGKGEYLERLVVVDIPTDNVWVFDNEFSSRKHGKSPIDTIDSQSSAFSSAGKKVETTILYHHNNRLYLFMIEMKRTVSPMKYKKDIVKKFESSLSTLSIFMSAHFDFPTFQQSQIFPVGICCYNYYRDTDPDYDRDIKQVAGAFRNNYDKGKREMLLEIEPLSLNRLRIPVLLFENPNAPVTNSFELPFNEIMRRILTML